MDTAVLDIVRELQHIRIDIQNSQKRLEDTIRDSLKCVDSLQRMLNDEFDLTTAVALCKAGYFVQHVDFGSRESMHYYDGSLYYEDGTEVTVQFLTDNNKSENWRVKKNPLEVDLIKLRDMHIEAEGMMLDSGSYEDCFK